MDDEQNIQRCARLWRMQQGLEQYPESVRKMIVEHMQILFEESMFTQALAFEYGGDLVLAVSNGRSTRLQAQNSQCMRRSEPVFLCFWTEFDVWTFRGGVLGNIACMTDPYEYPQGYHDQLGPLFERWLHKKTGMEPGRIRHEYFALGRQYPTEISQLGMIFATLSVPKWKWYVSGMSWRYFRGIDVYVKDLCSQVVDYDSPCVWYVVNASGPPYTRDFYRPDAWWGFVDWVCVGQRYAFFNDDSRVQNCIRAILHNPSRGMEITRQSMANNPTMISYVLEEAFRQGPQLIRLYSGIMLHVLCEEQEQKAQRGGPGMLEDNIRIHAPPRSNL